MHGPARLHLSSLSISLACCLALGGGCDREPASETADKPGAAPEADPGDAVSEPPSKGSAAPGVLPPAKCTASISVTGAQTFDNAELTPSLGVVDRKGESWISMQDNHMTGDPKYLLAFFTLAEAKGEVSFYDATRAMNLLNLTVIDGPDYSAFDTHDGGGDPGHFVVTKPREGWVEIHGKAKLSDGEGSEIEVQLDLTRALPPMKCP